jgi:hypothetical protein
MKQLAQGAKTCHACQALPAGAEAGSLGSRAAKPLSFWTLSKLCQLVIGAASAVRDTKTQ